MKSFATSICPIKKSSRSEYDASPRYPQAIPGPSPGHPSVADHPPTDLKTVSFRCHNRSSARRPCPEGHQSHPRAIPAPSPRGETITQPISKRFLSGVITALRHGDLAYRCFRAISAWRSSHLSALRHGDPAQRCLRGIPAWQRGYLSGLRHGHLAQRYLRAILA